MTNPTTKCAAFLVLVLAACGQDATQPLRDPDLIVDGVAILNDSIESYTQAEDFALRFGNVLTAMAAYAGRDAKEFEGLTVILQDGAIPCNSSSGTCSGTLTGRIIRLDALRYGKCIENSLLAHELLHALIEDECHTDSRWHTALWDGQGFQSYADILNADPSTTCHVFGSYQTVYPSC